jgi:hypothetical protein
VPFYKIGHAIDEAVLDINEFIIDVDDMRDVWHETSHLQDRQQSFNGMADERAQLCKTSRWNSSSRHIYRSYPVPQNVSKQP